MCTEVMGAMAYNKDDLELRRRIAETMAVVNHTEYVDPYQKDVWRVVNRVCLVIAYIVFFVSLWIFISYYWESYEAQGNERRLRQIHAIQAKTINMTVISGGNSGSLFPEVTGELVNTKELVFRQEMQEFVDINKDTAGYIKIPKTGVDGVVVQGEDDEYYLDHNFYGEKRQCGTLFVDSRCIINTTLDSPNLIIYGHNQYDGTMFGDLDFYRWNLEYWKSNPFVYFDTLYEEKTYVIIAAFLTNELPEHDNGNRFDYQNYIYFTKDWSFEDWSTELMLRTQFFTGVDFNVGDQYITLSTCATEWEPSRYVLVARALRDGESADSIDTSLWEENPNPKMPQIWYDVHGISEGWQPDNE